MTDHAVARAAPDEPIVHGACRPGYDTGDAGRAAVGEWIASANEAGIERVCCLLDGKLDRYDGLLESYREAFGADRVCHAPVPDYSLVDRGTLFGTILPFLRDARDASEPVVVHCSAGSGRTGHVLVAWLVCERGYSLDGALATVVTASERRNPTEAGSREELRALVEDCL